MLVLNTVDLAIAPSVVTDQNIGPRGPTKEMQLAGVSDRKF